MGLSFFCFSDFSIMRIYSLYNKKEKFNLDVWFKRMGDEQELLRCKDTVSHFADEAAEVAEAQKLNLLVQGGTNVKQK